FDVLKPHGTGSGTVSKVVTTDNRGNGGVSQFYPDPSFTAASGTVATDVGGVYNVYVNQTSPTSIGTVATGQFTVSSMLNVVVSQPVPGTVLQRGQTTIISATVSALSGPDNAATVYANTPSSGRLLLPQTSPVVYTINYLTSGQYAVGLSNPSGALIANLTAAYDTSRFGFYTSTGYPVSTFDPGGTWTLIVSANSVNDGFGNTGPDLATSVPLQIVTSPLS